MMYGRHELEVYDYSDANFQSDINDSYSQLWYMFLL
jgi:hypothetical protein